MVKRTGTLRRSSSRKRKKDGIRIVSLLPVPSHAHGVSNEYLSSVASRLNALTRRSDEREAWFQTALAQVAASALRTGRGRPSAKRRR
jgi:hypothetical protein